MIVRECEKRKKERGGLNYFFLEQKYVTVKINQDYHKSERDSQSPGCVKILKITECCSMLLKTRPRRIDRAEESPMKKETRLSLSPDTPRACRPGEFNLWKSQQIATGVCRAAVAGPFSWWFPHK